MTNNLQYIENMLPGVKYVGTLATQLPVDFSQAPYVLLPTTIKTITSLGTNQNSTPTAAQIMGGYLTQTSATGAGTVTLPTGTLLSAAASSALVGYGYECTFANLGGGQTLTITGATGSTVIGDAAIPSGKNATLRFINTGAATWNVYVIVSA